MKTFPTLVTLALSLAVGASANAQSYKLTKYLDTGTQVPGQAAGVSFDSFDSETPSFENGLFCFEGRFIDASGAFNSGIFTVDALGQVTPMMLRTDISPSGPAYGSESNELIDRGEVSWVSSVSRGLYIRSTAVGATTRIIADSATPIPNGSGALFDSFGEYGRSGDLVLFEARDPNGDEAVYLADLTSGALTLVAGQNTQSPFPGAVPSSLTGSFSEPMIRDGRFTVRARDSNGILGLLTDFGAGAVGPVNETVQSPSGLGRFTTFDESSIDGDKVVFQAGTANGNAFGVYLYDHGTGTFTTIADETVARPDGGFFDVFNGNPSISVEQGSTTVVFQADADTWAWIDGTLIPVVRAGDPLDGKTVSSSTTRFPYGVDGATTAMRVTFTDGTRALFLAELNDGVFTTSGLGCPTANPLTLSADVPPCVGLTTTVSCANVPASAIGTELVIGVGAPIVFPLDGLGMIGCTLYLGNPVFSLLQQPGTWVDFPLIVPNDPAIAGAQFSCQAATLAPGVNSFGVALSDLGEITVGG